MKLNPYLTSYTKVNLKWIANLNFRACILKLLDENVGVNFYNFVLDDSFLDNDTNSKGNERKMDKLRFIKIF